MLRHDQNGDYRGITEGCATLLGGMSEACVFQEGTDRYPKSFLKPRSTRQMKISHRTKDLVSLLEETFGSIQPRDYSFQTYALSDT